MPRESWYINESELDDYQVQIVRRRMERSFIVKGCAGSGKTVLALWRAKEIQEANLGTYYVIVFTKALRQFIDDGIKTIGIPSSNVLYHYQWKAKHCPKADYIIIDEVQDFNKEELQELQQAARKAFILFGDSAQQLYGGLKKNLLTMEGIQLLTGLPMENLVINHRLTKKIARLAERITRSDDTLEDRCRKEGTEKPKIIKSSSFEKQLDTVKDIIESKGYTDVGILFINNEIVKRAYQYFTKIGFDVEAKYDVDNRDSKMSLDFTSDNPKLMTYHSAKGLQFEAVFLPGCNANDEKHRNPLYVAITRSYSDLYILHSDELSDFISNVPNTIVETIDIDAAKKKNVRKETVLDIDDDLPF